MANLTATNAAKQDFLPLIQELARAQQQVSLFSAASLRQSGSGLTAPQANVIFTLGNTDGLTCSDIGARTLITKGTLTGIIDRLEAKGLVQRWGDENDGRRIIVDLTAKGKKVFQREFPRHVGRLKEQFSSLSKRDRDQATQLLSKVSALF